MKLPQLQAIATQLGLKGPSRLPKGDLSEAIKAHGDAPGEAAQGRGRDAPTGAPKQRGAGKATASAPAESTPADEGGSGKGQERRQDRGGARKPQRSGDQRGSDRRGKDQRGEQRGGSRQEPQRHEAQRAEAKSETLDVFAEFEAEPKTGESARVARLDDIQLPHAEEEDNQDNNARRRRGRDRRDRKRRPNQRESQAYEEVDVADGDVLIPIAGVLDVLEDRKSTRLNSS